METWCEAEAKVSLGLCRQSTVDRRASTQSGEQTTVRGGRADRPHYHTTRYARFLTVHQNYREYYGHGQLVRFVKIAPNC